MVLFTSCYGYIVFDLKDNGIVFNRMHGKNDVEPLGRP